MGATSDAGDTARAREAQEAAAAALREEDARTRADMDTSRLSRSTGDTSARQEMIRSIRARRAAEEEKIDADRRELAASSVGSTRAPAGTVRSHLISGCAASEACCSLMLASRAF